MEGLCPVFDSTSRFVVKTPICLQTFSARTPGEITISNDSANTPALHSEWDKNSRNSFLAGFLSWTFDAFDFFILTYVLSQVASEFHRPTRDIVFTLTASLAMRPLGAFIFGLMGDRYGRRIPLAINIVFFSIMEIASGLSHNFHMFLLFRLLYGVGMGGTWGVSASLVMESSPIKIRGLLSGILQEGYALGNLLAAIAFWTLFPRWGWRPMFFIGVIPAFLTLIVLLRVKDGNERQSTPASRISWRDYFQVVTLNWKRGAYLMLFMTVMTFLAHGTQDLYPTFLQQQHHYGPSLTAKIAIISMIGAICGGTIMGFYSDRVGRRRSLMTSMVGGLMAIAVWAFSPGIALTMVGAFLMQFMVQGAWGVVPAHINELSPAGARAFMPGFAYQAGALIAGTAPYIQVSLTRYFSYGQVMGAFAAIILAVGLIAVWYGPEAYRVSLRQS